MSDVKRDTSEVMSGMVRTTHRESGHLVFTASGDVMLPPRGPAPEPRDDPTDPPRRGRGRPRKTPLPLTPKIKKRRGRPPKTSLGQYFFFYFPSTWVGQFSTVTISY